MLFQHPSPPPPSSLTRVQFLLVADLVLLNPDPNVNDNRNVESVIEDLINADTTLTPSERRGLLIRFRGANEFPRDWPNIELLAPGLTSEAIDDLFRYGATL